MITFPDLNSLKFSSYNSEMQNYRNTLYDDFTRGINQRMAYSKRVQTAVFGASDRIVMQIAGFKYTEAIGIYVYNNGTFTYYGEIYNDEIDGSTSQGVDYYYRITDVFDIVMPALTEGYSYILIINGTDQYISEWFYVDGLDYGRNNDPHLLDIQYKNRTGYENGYYWSGSYQNLKVEQAHLTDGDIDIDQETAEGINQNTEVLNASGIEWEEYTLTNIPEYLAKKIVKASIQTDLLVRGRAMAYRGHSFGEKRDGRIDFTISYKYVEQKNQYKITPKTTPTYQSALEFGLDSGLL